MFGIPAWALMVILVWALFWKALALWKSARLNQPIWFIIMLLINTFGILEILYIFLFSEIKFAKGNNNPKRKANKPKRKR
jgi:hypothetical protein